MEPDQGRVMSTTVVFVGAVVMRDSRILFVRQSRGHPLEGQWTVPWGRVDPAESPSAAAVRETWEEGGVQAKVEGLLGVQELPIPQKGCFALAYLCSHQDGKPAPMDRETDSAAYYSAAELDELEEPIEPWSDWLARRVFSGRYTLVRSDPTNPLSEPGTFL